MIITTKQVWDDFGIRLRGFILSQVQNAEDTNDLLQDVFTKIHANLDTLADHEKITAWVFQITRNTIIDFYRRKKHTPLPDNLTSEYIEDFDPLNQEAEASDWLKPFISLLPEKYQQALLLSELGDLKLKDLANKIDLTESAAKMRVHRARQKLKAILQECCSFELDRSGRILDYKMKNKTPCGCRDNGN